MQVHQLRWSRLPQLTFADRVRMLRRRWRLLLRLSLATSLALFIARDVLHHPQAFFAPVAAVIVIVAGAGLRVRALAELVVGVATGVLAAELMILAIGRGPWQMAVVIVTAVSVATLLGLKGIALNQAAVSSVLLTTVMPAAGTNPAFTRFTDALVGGLSGLLLIVVLPRNVVRDIDREVQTVLGRLSGILRTVASALRDADAGQADSALERARSMQPLIDQMTATAANVSEIARLAPLRWRHRSHVELYAEAVTSLDNAVRDTRVLARKSSALLRHHEPVPPDLPTAIDLLANAIGVFADDLVQRDDFEQARTEVVQAARLASRTLPAAATINSAAIAAQVRSLAADFMYATGYTRDEIEDRLDTDS